MADEDVVQAIPLLDERGRGSTFVRWTLPLTALLALVLSVFLVFPTRFMGFFGFLVTYLVPPAGKESVIPAAVAAGYAPFLVATYIAGLDMTVAWLLAWNWDALSKLPLVGGVIGRTTKKGQEWLKDKALVDRSAFFGLVGFVFVPLQGSGAIAGVALGRLIGLPAQRAWVAIMIGALLAAFLWAYAAGAVRSLVGAVGWSVVLQVAVVLLAVGVLGWLVSRRIRSDEA